MLVLKNLLVAAAAVALGSAAFAAVSPEEAKKLGGPEYNEVGALRAGNKDGSIPAYSGKVPPAAAKPPASAGKFNIGDPYAEEKVLYSVDAKNMDQYADKLSEGVKTLMRKNPGFRIDVYPTHRDQYFSKAVLEETKKCATTAKLVADGVGLTGASACIPFPLPQSGYEVMWNAVLRHRTPNEITRFRIWLVNSSGSLTLSNDNEVLSNSQFWDASVKEPKYYSRMLNTNRGPVAKAGAKDLRVTPLRMDQEDSRAWQYIPGQRRVRLAPEFKYDTVSTSTGGLTLYDEIALFDGKMDRFDFSSYKLKEMLVPFNTVKSQYVSAETLAATKNYPDPSHIRWELRRVWEVSAPLKPGQRHIYNRKVFYVDADAWAFVLYDSFDQANKIYRTAFSLPFYYQQMPAIYPPGHVMFEMNKGIWGLVLHFNDRLPIEIIKTTESDFSPDTLAGSSVR